MPSERPICFMFDRHEVRRGASRARAKTGKRIAARMAIMAITTRSSIRVKPDGDLRRGTNIVLPPFLADDSPSALPAPPHHSKRGEIVDQGSRLATALAACRSEDESPHVGGRRRRLG